MLQVAATSNGLSSTRPARDIVALVMTYTMVTGCVALAAPYRHNRAAAGKGGRVPLPWLQYFGLHGSGDLGFH